MNTSFEKTKQYIKKCQQKGETVALVKGVFDLIHPDHVLFLKNAKNLADRLVVLLISDTATAAIKPGRPIQDQASRVKVMNSLKTVDFAEVDYDSGDPETGKYSKDRDISLLKELNPNVWIVSSGRKEKFIELDLGQIEIVELSSGSEHSTTGIVNKILVTYAEQYVKESLDSGKLTTENG